MNMNIIKKIIFSSIRYKFSSWGSKEISKHNRTTTNILKDVQTTCMHACIGELTHAPGPNGLPAGYPVRLSAKGAEVVLPEELSLAEAIKVNEEAQQFDGIQEIRDDGTVVFTEKAVRTMRKMLNYECKALKLEESEERAIELRTLYKKFARKYA